MAMLLVQPQADMAAANVTPVIKRFDLKACLSVLEGKIRDQPADGCTAHYTD